MRTIRRYYGIFIISHSAWIILCCLYHFCNVCRRGEIITTIRLFSCGYLIFNTILFISNDYNSMQNYLLILNMGVVMYAWMAIKGFWSKPLKLK
ncbi:DUF5080 family protein [Staphylococcus epidermidis]|nr:DUF5080 family protein [Staphylococcus epidermidis]MBF2224493.1 DUF5080 family protein [Staphylococcus epidermidis]MBM6226225.1 DUF5080 family protein [Staphylococcus epidermidis]MBM6230843.1 DUF5080 family protein [Staphylococcus epidermidis]MBM6233135.1 DUF5080 family protein [Staphylococcus epidermidis]